MYVKVVEKGKDFLEDLKTKDDKAVEEAKKEIKTNQKQRKKCRERLKDKGLCNSNVTELIRYLNKR